MRRAFTQAQNGRPRPTMVEIPTDVYGEEVAEPLMLPPHDAAVRTAPDPVAVGEVARVLVAAARPVIYAGQGVHYAKAWAQLRELAELLEAPVTTSLEGKSAFPENHPLSLGSGGPLDAEAGASVPHERRRDLRHRLQLRRDELRRHDAEGQNDHSRHAGSRRHQQGHASPTTPCSGTPA